MTSTPLSSRSPRRWWAAGACAVAGGVLFQFFGNATRGYVDTASTFWWWVSQWLDPQADAEHGWLILGISAWLLGRNLRRAKRGECEVERVQCKAVEVPTGDRRRDFSAPSHFKLSSSTDLVALATMVAALALHALGFVAQQTRFSILAVLLFTWGVLRLGGGKRWGGAAMFPLGFLVFALPLNVLDSLGFWLRLWVVDAAGAFAQITGIELTRSGTQLFSPDGRYQYDVAAACSGVRSLMALAALSLLIGYLNFRSGWRRALLLGLCFPLTYLGNVVRIVAVIVAAQIGGQAWGERMHDGMGFGVFVIVLGGVLVAAKLLQRWGAGDDGRGTANDGRSPVDDQRERGERGAERLEPRAEAEESRVKSLGVRDELPERGRHGEASGPALGTRRPRRVDGDESVAASAGDSTRSSESSGEGVVPRSGSFGEKRARRGAESAPYLMAAAIVALAVGEMVFFARVAARPAGLATGVRLAEDGKNPVELPAFIGTEWIGQKTAITAVERQILPGDTSFARRNYVPLQGGGHAVFFSVVLSGRDRTSIHRPEICLVGQGWTIRDSSRRTLAWADRPEARLPVTLLHTELIARTGGRTIPTLTAYWFVSSDATVATHGERFLHDAWNRVRHGRADRWAYVLMQTDAMDGDLAALARMEAVLAGVWPGLATVKGGQ